MKQITIIETGATDSFDRPLYKEQNGERLFVNVSVTDEPIIYAQNENGGTGSKVENFTIAPSLQSIADDLTKSFENALNDHSFLRKS